MPKVFIRNYLIFAAVLLVCVGSLGYILVSGDHQIDKSDSWVSYTHSIIIESEELNTRVAQMVASQRGYLVSGDEDFLTEYEERKAAVSRHVANLSDLTADNLSQQSRLQELRQYIAKLTEQLELTLDQYDVDASRLALDDMGVVKRLKKDIFRVNADFLEEEYGLLNQRIKIVENRKDQYLLTLLIGGSVAVILLMLFNGYLLRVQSKRSAAEAALGETEEVFKLAVEGTQDGVFDWNIKTDDVFYSDQFIAMLGCEKEDFIGTVEDFSTRLHPDEKDKVWEYIELYLDEQLSEYENTFQMRHKSGRWIWVKSRGKFIRDKQGKPSRMIGAHTDVSAEKEYEQRLQEAKIKAEQANRAKSDFLAHMSHEIRTPLTTISGAAEILQQNMKGLDKKRRELIKVLNSSSVSLKDLISDVLDFSKIESGELELEESAFDLSDAFEHIVSIMSVKTAEQNLDFKFNFDDVKDVRFYGDPVRLRQVMINLIGNAVKFTEKGHVHVTARSDKKDDVNILRIDVEDTGIGIARDQQDVVFERFKQADSSVSRKYGGTGLGLPISKNLVSLMGGDIQLQSVPGRGSTFTVILPMRSIGEDAEKRRTSKVKQHKINDQLRSIISDSDKILIVEDYEGNIVVLGYIMEEMGMEFDVARTGLEAVNQWKENHYDLVLMDIQMPEMDGFTATKQIRKMEKEQNLDATPIVGMTAHALIGDKDKCIEAGMDAYLPKPIVEIELKNTILRFLKLKNKAA